MTVLALLLEACRLAGVREPLDFYALSPHAQDLWMAHAANTVSGAYAPRRKAGPSKPDPEQWAARAAAAAKARGVLEGGG